MYPNLVKLGDGLDESPIVMVGEKQMNKLGKNRGILKPSWAFVETKSVHAMQVCLAVVRTELSLKCSYNVDSPILVSLVKV